MRIALDPSMPRCCYVHIATQRRCFSMREVVEQALQTSEWATRLDDAQLARSRQKITQYIDTLVSAGHNDPDRLAEYACAYLRQMHEAHDPRFTGC